MVEENGFVYRSNNSQTRKPGGVDLIFFLDNHSREFCINVWVLWNMIFLKINDLKKVCSFKSPVMFSFNLK